jgi:hypothetical protein
MDPFARLGVAPGASVAELRAARRRLAKELHPDLGDGRTHEAMAEVNAAFEDAITAAVVEEPVTGAREPAGPGDQAEDEATFSVDVLPVEACEILIVVCRILGEVLAVEEPYAIEAYLEVPEPCFCALTLAPEAGGTQITVEAEPADHNHWRGPAAVRDAVVDELVALTTPAKPASR